MGRDPFCLRNSKPCMRVAEEASKKALKNMARITFLVTGAVEVVSTSWELWTLYKQKKDEYITQNDFKRECCKKVSGGIGATVGSIGLGVFGTSSFSCTFGRICLGKCCRQLLWAVAYFCVCGLLF